MVDSFAVREGPFGRAEVVQVQNHLVAHSHPHVHFTLWLKGGTAHAHVGTQRVEVSQHLALAVNPHASHDLRLDESEPSTLLMNLYLNAEWVHNTGASDAHPLFFPQCQITVSDAIRSASTILLGHMSSPMEQEDLQIETDVAQLVQSLMHAPSPSEASSAVALCRAAVDPRLHLAMAHMQAHLEHPTKALNLAHQVGLSRSRLFELFQSELATTPLVFWNAMRTEQARSRLMSESESLSHMAFDLGFSSPGNFSRFFKDHLGVTPSIYRRVCHAT